MSHPIDAIGFLRNRRAKLLGQVETLDELLRDLLAEMGRADGGDGADDPTPPAVTPAARPPKPPAPAAAPRKPSPASRPGGQSADYAAVADALAGELLGGPLSFADLVTRTGEKEWVVRACLSRRGDWFRMTGRGPGCKWELTTDGRSLAQQRREPEEAD